MLPRTLARAAMMASRVPIAASLRPVSCARAMTTSAASMTNASLAAALRNVVPRALASVAPARSLASAARSNNDVSSESEADDLSHLPPSERLAVCLENEASEVDLESFDTALPDGWSVQNFEGASRVVLARTFGDNEQIRVVCDISPPERYFDVEEDEMMENEEGEHECAEDHDHSEHHHGGRAQIAQRRGQYEQEEEEQGQFGSEEEEGDEFTAEFSILISRGNKGYLNFHCVSDSGILFVDGLTHHKGDINTGVEAVGKPLAGSVYQGPSFTDLTVETQQSVLDFLEERGIDDDFTVDVANFMRFKAASEFVNWSKTVRKFLA